MGLAARTAAIAGVAALCGCASMNVPPPPPPPPPPPAALVAPAPGSAAAGASKPRLAGRPAAPTSARRAYFDERRKRWYYFDAERHRYFWEDGTPKT